MDWRDFVHSDPHILNGKPVIKGTRLAVEFLLGLLSVGWSFDQILVSYPNLKPEALQAMFAFTAEMLRQEPWHAIAPETL